jgi:hypothetical protein
LARIEAQYSSICESTVGIVFFGTPHRGSDKATYGKILGNVASTVMHKPTSKLLSALQSNSDVLARLTSDFRHQLPNYQVVTFYETKPLGLFKKEVSSQINIHFIDYICKANPYLFRLLRSSQQC